MIRLRLTYLAVATLAACSAVEDNRMPDAPVADTTAPTIMKATPANMAKRVSVIEPIVVQLDEDLDPATVMATSVDLSYEEPLSEIFRLDPQIYGPTGPGMAPKHPVPATVTYDAVARTIRIVPKAPLPYSRRFTLAFTGIKDTAGNELSDGLHFTSAVNARMVEHDFDTNAQPTLAIETGIDANGFTNTYIGFNGPGTDTQWFTPDDTAYDAWKITVTPEGRLSLELYLQAGLDTILNTPDDVAYQGIITNYDAMNHLLERYITGVNGQGTDMVYGTNDDLIQILYTYTYANNQPTRQIVFSSAGVDTIWRNGDDNCAVFFDHTYDMAGHRTREVEKNCGSDMFAATADDAFISYSEHQYDANHALTRTAIRSGPGLNTTWLDDDDAYSSIEKLTNDANGLNTLYIHYTGPGVDTVWGTPDDVATTLTKTLYDTNKQPIEVTSYGPGLDTKLGTADDVVAGYTRTTYDALGNRIVSRTYDLGPDAVAYTGDDRLLSMLTYDTMH